MVTRDVRPAKCFNAVIVSLVSVDWLADARPPIAIIIYPVFHAMDDRCGMRIRNAFFHRRPPRKVNGVHS